MNQIQNNDFDSNKQSQNISRKKIAAIISVVLVVAVVAVLSKNSYASISGTSNQAAFFTNPFNNIFESSNENSSNNEQGLTPDTTGFKKGVKKFHFYEKENGDRIHYKAKLKDGKLTDLYVDGDKVPENELGKYESKVQKKIGDYEDTMRDYKKNKDEYKKFTKEYSTKMKEFRDKMRDFHREHYDWNFDFDIPEPDLSELRDAMKELRKELKENLADGSIPPIHIPGITIPPIHIPPVPPVHIDKDEWKEWSDEFKDNMEEFKDKMKDHKWNMEAFNESMKDYGEKMKKFGNFIKEMKNELINDGIINSGDEIEELLLSEDRMEVNGKSVSKELHKKYKDLYENHTGKKIEGKNKIRINE